MNHGFDLFTIAFGVVIIVVALVSDSDVYRAHGPVGGRYGPPIEPRWLGKLLLVVFGIVVILDGISAIRHR